MWLRELEPDYQTKESGINNLNFLWHKDKIYIMDNHLAAAYCWLESCDKEAAYNFIHIDQHTDFLCNHPLKAYPSNLDTITIDEYCALQYNGMPLFQWDNYIKPIQMLNPRWFSYNVFSVPKVRVDIRTQALVPHMCIDYIHPFELGECMGDLFSESRLYASNKWIVNIDIDVFFDDGSRVFDDEYVRKIANILNENIDKIHVLTLCLSPECCGIDLESGWQNAISVLNTFNSQLGAFRDLNFPTDYD